MVSTTREVQTLEVCLQQGAALPAGGVKEDFEDIWSGPARKGRISKCRATREKEKANLNTEIEKYRIYQGDTKQPTLVDY